MNCVATDSQAVFFGARLRLRIFLIRGNVGMKKFVSLVLVMTLITGIFCITSNPIEAEAESINSFLSAYYSFDDPNNIGKDYSGKGRHAAAVVNVEAVKGVYGGGIETSGGSNGSSYIQMNKDILNDSDSFTLSLWIKRTEDNGDSFAVSLHGTMSDKSDPYPYEYMGLITKGYGTNETLETNCLCFEFRKNQKTLTSMNVIRNPVATNVWAHYALSYDAEQHKAVLYLNGEAIYTDTNVTVKPSDLKTHSNFLARSHWYWDNDFKGQFDDVKIYSKALTAEEIQDAKGYPIPKQLDGLSISFGNKVSGTVPGDNPFFGGANIGLDLPTIVPITAKVDGGKVYIALGIDAAKYTSGTKSANDSYSKNDDGVKLLVQNIKHDWNDAKKGITDLKKIKKKYKWALKDQKANFGFSGDFSIIGFGEGYIDANGDLIITEAGIIPTFALDWKWSGQFAIGPVPCYWEAFIKAELEAQLNLYLNQAVKQFTPNGIIEFELKLGGGGGVGINKLATVGGGVQGTAKPRYEMNLERDDYFKLTAKYGAYFKAVLAFASYEKHWDSREYLWLEHPDSTSAASLMALDDFDMYNPDNYSLLGREYAESESEFTANERYMTLFAFRPADKEEKTFKTNIYPYSDPQLAELSDGTLLAVWLDDDSTRSDINRTSLYYSYNKDGEWSEPEAVDDDSTADFMPQIKVVGDKAYLVWCDTKDVMDDTDDFETVFGAWEISCAEFDGEGFGSIQTLTDDGKMDMMPTLFGDGEKIYAAWVKNNSNDVFTQNADYSVIVREIDGEAEVFAADLYAIDSISGTVIDGNVQIAYAMDGDGDESDNTDKEIYLNNERLTNNDYLDSKPVFSGGRLYWYADGNITEYDAASGSASSILPEEDPITNDRFDIIDDGNGNRAIVFAQADNLAREICAYIYDSASGKWGGKIALTDMASDISSFSGVFSSDGSMKFIVNKTEIVGDIDSENPYGQTDLVLFSVNPSYDLAMEDVYFDQSTLMSGNTLEFDMTVKNVGELTAQGYGVEVLDESGAVLATTYVKEALLPGEAREFTAYYPLGDAFVPHNVSLRLTLIGEEDADESDNTFDAELNYEDLAVENIGYGLTADGNAVVYGSVVNRGYGESGSVTVRLCRDSVDGEEAGASVIEENIGTLSSALFSFEVPYEEGALYYALIDSADMNSGDNYDFVVFQNADYAYMIDSAEITETGVKADVTAISGQEAELIAAAYDENEHLTDVSITGISLANGESASFEAALNLTGAKYVEVYIWNSKETMVPLSGVVKINIE